VEELHEFGKMNDSENMLLEATGGLMSRPEGFTMYISTQSTHPPAGMFASKLQYARDVRDGVIEDNNFLPVIYEYPQAYLKEKLYLRPENFYITNPNLGASVDVKTIEGLHREATHKGIEAELLFASKHLNVEIGLNLRSDRWAGADAWQKNGDNTLTLDVLLERCDVVSVGIDGGGADDLLGFAVLGKDRITGAWLAYTHAWVMEIGLERRKSEAARMRDFALDGDLTIVSGTDGSDIKQLTDVIKRVYDSGKLYHAQYDERGKMTETPSIGVDPIGLGMILTVLKEKGVPVEMVTGISQGYKMMPQIKALERKLLEGQFIHSGSKLMAWCVGNAMVVPAGNAIMITKQASGFAKIDPLMALLDAAAIMVLDPSPVGGGMDEALMNPIFG
jgi:phage terminase large subunit-like protein